MSKTISLHAHDLDGYLTERDNAALDEMKVLYDSYLEDCRKAEEGGDTDVLVRKMKIITKKMQEITGLKPRENSMHRQAGS